MIQRTKRGRRFSTARLHFLMFLSLSNLSFAFAQTSKPRVAIKTFDNPPEFQGSGIGNALTEILTTELGRFGKYRIVERQAAQELMKEIDFGKSDYAKSSTFAGKGNLSGAEYFLMGKVTQFSFRETVADQRRNTLGAGSTQVVYVQQADVRVDFRLVNTKSGEIVLSESGSAREVNHSIRSENHIWYGLTRSNSFGTSELPNSLIGRTALKAIANVVRKLSDLSTEAVGYTAGDSAESITQQLSSIEGQILGSISASEFVVSLGSKDGLAKGDQLIVFSEVPVRNKKGVVIFKKRQETGKLEITDVTSASDRAIARFIPGTGEVGATQPQEGDPVNGCRPCPYAPLRAQCRICGQSTRCLWRDSGGSARNSSPKRGPLLRRQVLFSGVGAISEGQ